MTHGEYRYTGVLAVGATTVIFSPSPPYSNGPEDKTLYQMYVGAGLTATTLTFQKRDDGVNWKNYCNPDGSVYTVTVAADTFVRLPPYDFLSIAEIQITAGATQLTAPANITIYARDLP